MLGSFYEHRVRHRPRRSRHKAGADTVIAVNQHQVCGGGGVRPLRPRACRPRLLRQTQGRGTPHSRKVDVRLPNSKSHGARPVHLIITMIKWIRTSRLSIKNSLSTTHSRIPNPQTLIPNPESRAVNPNPESRIPNPESPDPEPRTPEVTQRATKGKYGKNL